MPTPNFQAFAFLAARRSHPAKQFAGPVPSRDALKPILEAALRVPDHGKLEPWRLIVLEKPDMARLATLAADHAIAIGADSEKTAKARGQFDIGQLAVVVIASPKPSDKVPLIEQTLSAGALCFGLLNAAQAAGWGANWLSGWPSHDKDFIATAFGCAPGETVAGIVHLGTPSHDGADRPRPDLERVVQWGLA